LLEELLEQAPSAKIQNLRALIVPHAGYRFSGATAAAAYKLVVGHDFQNVIVMGPSHYAAFKGAALPDAQYYRTPLGNVTIAPGAAELGKHPPFCVNPPCDVRGPSWSPRPRGSETPFTYEHSVEVQLPFLQKTLPGVPVIPVVIGQADPESMAKVLESRLDDRTLLIASSDLSHFHSYSEALKLDHSCVEAICNLDVSRMGKEEACGKLPILTLMGIAKQKGWKTKLLDARNSGDIGAGKDSVVGYAAIAFYEDAKPTAQYTSSERNFLLELARKTIASVSRGGPMPDPKAPDPAGKLSEVRACFVTLMKDGQLRGCIGQIYPQEPLLQAVVHNARAAALQDSRFPQVTAEEVPRLEIEISVLTVPSPLAFNSPEELLAKLKPHRDGVVLRSGFRQATYLPSVWEQLPDKVKFLTQLSQKAGGPGNMWKQPGVEVLIYHVEAFTDKS
jgi:AmmeMemoRadiSam system protein B/AmmeMemoRadiSam system protein A